MISIQTKVAAVRPETQEEARAFLEALSLTPKRQFAREYNIPESTIRGWIQHCKHLVNGFQGVPEGHFIKGVSYLEDMATGEQKLRWVKTNLDAEQQAYVMQEVAEGLMAKIEPLEPATNTPECSSDLLACYVLSDFHLGMFAHKEEGGEDWDLERAEQALNNWVDKALIMSPNAHTGVFLQLGDFCHIDGLDPVTPKHRHPLDSGARFQKIVQVAVRGARRVVSRMLEKHEHVVVIMADANHDPASSVWLRQMFSVLYENEPRVTVDVTEFPYYCVEWGDTSIFAHHGDKRNLSDVSKVFAAMYRDVFGRTKYSYGHIGHYHHTASKEDGLMAVQIHATLAPKDSYATRHGYTSQRRAKTIIYHKKYGEVGSSIVTPDMLT